MALAIWTYWSWKFEPCTEVELPCKLGCEAGSIEPHNPPDAPGMLDTCAWFFMNFAMSGAKSANGMLSRAALPQFPWYASHAYWTRPSNVLIPKATPHATQPTPGAAQSAHEATCKMEPWWATTHDQTLVPRGSTLFRGSLLAYEYGAWVDVTSGSTLMN